MDRRTYLATTAAVIGVGTAGCQNGEETAQEDQPSGEATETAPSDRTGDIGATLGTEAGIQVTYEDIIATQTVVTSNAATQAMDGRRFVLLKLSVRNNTGSETRLPGGDRFELAAGTNTYRRTTVTEGGGFGSDSGRIQQPVLGDEYRAVDRVDPGAVTAGWLVVSVPADRSEFTLQLTEVTTEAGEQPTWSVVADASDVATCSVSVDGPETVTQGTEASYTVTAENTGNRTVRCYRAVTATRGQQEQTATVARSLDPGATAETTLSITPAGIGTFTVVSTVRTHVETPVAVPTFQFGESWTPETGLRMTVSDVQFAQEATYQPEYEDETVTVEAGADSKFAFFYLEAENIGNSGSVDFPHRVSVRVEVASTGTVSRIYDAGGSASTDWTEPVSGGTYYGSYPLNEPGDSESGWFVATVPDTVSPDDLFLRLHTTGETYNTEIGAKWTGG